MASRPLGGFSAVPTTAALLAAMAMTALSARADAADARTLCVGGSGCFPTIQLAVDAARDGDTVKVGRGTFAGGVTIAKSIALVGAGAPRTTVKGGGPVVAIGDSAEARRIDVTLRGLTITGGLNRGNVNWTPDSRGFQAWWGPQGGGVLVDGADVTKAETVVTIVDCVITRNRVQPSARSGFGNEPWSATAEGGGIANIGRLTLIRTTVSDNVAGGGFTTRAKGGGIFNATAGGPGSLTIRDSRVLRNAAIVTADHPERAEGGGIEAQDGLKTFVLSGSVVSGNRAILDTHDPSGASADADAGGIQIGGDGRATIVSTRITGNISRVVDPRGKSLAYGSALVVRGPSEQLTIRDSTITGNRTEATVLTADKPGPTCCQGDVVEISSGGTVTRTTIARNTNIVRAQRGTVVLFGTIFSANADSAPLVFVDSVIERNTSRATNVRGTVWAVGGGVANFGLMELRHTRVSRNTLTAIGKSGFARGGGILNGPWDTTTGRLRLTGGTVVTRNVVRGAPGIALAGGGVYADVPVTIRSARILGNAPDQCHGCRK